MMDRNAPIPRLTGETGSEPNRSKKAFIRKNWKLKAWRINEYSCPADSKDTDLKTCNSGTEVCNFTVAVDRRVKKGEDKRILLIAQLGASRRRLLTITSIRVMAYQLQDG